MKLYQAVIIMSLVTVQVLGQTGIKIIPGTSGVREMIKNLGKAKDSASILSTLLLLNPQRINVSSQAGIYKNGDRYMFNFTDNKLMNLLHDRNGSKLISVNQVEMTGRDMNVPLLGELIEPHRNLEIAAIDTTKGNTTITKNRGADFMKLLLGLTQVAGTGANQIFKSIGMGSASVDGGGKGNDEKVIFEPSSKPQDSRESKSDGTIVPNITEKKISDEKNTNWSYPHLPLTKPLGDSPYNPYLRNRRVLKKTVSTVSHHQIKRRTTEISWGPGFTVSYASSPKVKVVDNAANRVDTTDKPLQEVEKDSKAINPPNSAQNDENPVKILDSEADTGSDSNYEGAKEDLIKESFDKKDHTRESDKGRSQLDMYNFKNRPLFLKSGEDAALPHNDKSEETHAVAKGQKGPHVSNHAQLSHGGYIQAPGNSPPYYIGQDVPYGPNMGYSNYNHAFPQMEGMKPDTMNGNPNNQFYPGYEMAGSYPQAIDGSHDVKEGGNFEMPGPQHQRSLPSQEIPTLFNGQAMQYQSTVQESNMQHYDPANGPYPNPQGGSPVQVQPLEESTYVTNEAHQQTEQAQQPTVKMDEQHNIITGVTFPENSQPFQHESTQPENHPMSEMNSNQGAVEQETEEKPIYTERLPPDSVYPPLEAQALPPYQDGLTTTQSEHKPQDSYGQSASNQVLMSHQPNPNYPTNQGYLLAHDANQGERVNIITPDASGNETQNVAAQYSYTPPYYYHQGEAGGGDGRDAMNYNEAAAVAAAQQSSPYQYGPEGLPPHMMMSVPGGMPSYPGSPMSPYHSPPTSAGYPNSFYGNQPMDSASPGQTDSTTNARPSIVEQQSIFDDIKSRSGGRYPPYMTQSGYSQSRDQSGGMNHIQGAPMPQGNFQPMNSPMPSNNMPQPHGSNAAQVNGYDTFQEGQNQRIPYGNLDETPGDDETSLLDAEYLRARSNHRPGLEGTTSWVNPQSLNTGYGPNPISISNVAQELPPPPQAVAAQSSDIVAQAKSAFNEVSGQASYVQSSNFGTQFSGFPKAQPPVSKKYQTNGIIGVQVKCNLNRNELIFTVHFKDRFYGLVYTKGYYKVEQCRTRGHGSQTVSLVLPLDGCGNTIVSQGWDLSSGVTTFVSRLVIIFDTNLGIITSHDTAYKATCTLGGAGAPALESGIQVPMLLPHGMQPSAMVMPPAWMSIVQGKDPQAPPSQILNLGQIGTVVIKLHDTQGNFDIYAYNCFAHDGMGMGRIQLLDYNGCPVHTQIVGPQSREVVHGSLSIFFHFKVFKFPDVNNVYFVCEIKICYKKCQQPNCGLFTANKQKRRRRSLSEIYSPEIPLHEIHNSSLIYGMNSTKLKNALNKTALNNSEINLKVESRDSINFPITNSIEGVKTSTIFQSIMVKIPLEQDEGEEQVNNNDIHPLLSHTGPKDNKSFSYEADEDHLSADDENAIEISGQEVHEKTIGYRDGGVLRKSALAEKREVCVSKTAFATSLGSLFAFVIIITTFAFYQLSKRQLKKFSSKLSSFDNQEYYENSCEKDSRQILPFDFGSVRSNGGNTAFQQTSFDGISKCEVVNKDADITAKNTFPLRIKTESVYKS